MAPTRDFELDFLHNTLSFCVSSRDVKGNMLYCKTFRSSGKIRIQADQQASANAERNCLVRGLVEEK
jgi:hypothetical protein